MSHPICKVYQAGVSNSPREKGDSFDMCLEGMHEMIKELIQVAFDRGREYEQRHIK